MQNDLKSKINAFTLGAGAWGSTLASLASGMVIMCVWSRRCPDLEAVLKGAEIVLSAIIQGVSGSSKSYSLYSPETIFCNRYQRLRPSLPGRPLKSGVAFPAHPVVVTLRLTCLKEIQQNCQLQLSC